MSRGLSLGHEGVGGGSLGHVVGTVPGTRRRGAQALSAMPWGLSPGHDCAGAGSWAMSWGLSLRHDSVGAGSFGHVVGTVPGARLRGRRLFGPCRGDCPRDMAVQAGTRTRIAPGTIS